METLKGGAYTECPFKSLPTGYMVWAVENGKFKRQWEDIHNELTRRYGFYKMRMNPEPKWDAGCENESWYQDWDVAIQLRYISMITEGAWHWDNIQPKHKDAMDRLNAVLNNLNTMFPEQKQISTFEDLFNDDDLGPGETVDDITFEEANEFLNKKLDLHLQTPLLHPNLLLKDGKVSAKKPVTADDIIHMIRSRNSANAMELAYQSVLNELESVTKLVAEQQTHFDMWEMRDIAWHLEVVRNRMYWLLRQREDDLE